MADRGSGAADSASAEIGKYLDILAKDPNSRVFAPLAEAYRKAGLLDDAIETALEGLRIHPNYLGGRVALGRALFEKKRYAEAADELRKVVKVAPDNIIAHKVLGQVALAQGNHADAEKFFRTVTFLDPHDRDAKRALDEISATAAAAPVVTAAASPAPSLPPSIAPESSWLEIPSEVPLAAPPETEPYEIPPEEKTLPAAPPPQILDPHAVEEIALEPASGIFAEPEATPSSPAGELEEPDEAPPPATSPIELHEPEAPALPVLEEMADEETVASETVAADEAVFEIFTRGPRYEPTVPRGAPRGERTMFEELELEPAADIPPAVEEGEPPIGEPAEEMPRIGVLDDLALEFERSFAPAPAAAEPAAVEPPAMEPPLVDTFAPEPAPAVELAAPGEEIGWEEESVWLPSAEEGEAPAPLLAPEEAATEELVSSEPPVAEETIEESAEEAVEEAAGETFADLEVAEAEPAPQPAPEPAPVSPIQTAPEASAGRSIFDTETLATIYINQGFYGRAAAIYERLVAGSPEDVGLRRKLDEVRERERAQGGQAGGGAQAGAPAAAAAGGSDRAETIRRLEALMEAFRKGRS